jgi:hypothetical protein
MEEDIAVAGENDRAADRLGLLPTAKPNWQR